MKKLFLLALVLVVAAAAFAQTAQVVQEGTGRPVNINLSFGGWILKLLVALGWILVASIGFALGVGIALKVFNALSTNIDEWEEIKKGNWSVAMIITSLIVMVGLLAISVLR
jgi:uncharacterized membrane protein YjfL (UPF0719 family)